MKITYKEKEIELKYSMRSMLMYENITEKTFAPQSFTDIITFMFCVVVASSKDYSITFEDFIDYLDENPGLVSEFSQWVVEVMTVQDGIKKN